MASPGVLLYSSPQTSTMFPLSRLPNEILLIVFERLSRRSDQRDIPHLRLVCKRFADIGSYYLLSEAHLFFKSSQFERLRQISEHPIISKKIDTLFYEADMLTSYGSMQDWRANICVPNWFHSIRPDSPMPSLGCSAREERAHSRTLAKAMHGPEYPRSEILVRRAYEKYKGYLADQESMRLQNFNLEVLKDALMKMPNVKTIELSTECCLGRSSTLMGDAFKDGLAMPYADMQSEEGCGVGQLRSLLVAAEAAGLKFETLAAGNVDWRFFQESGEQNQEVLWKMQRSVRALQTLKLYISTRNEHDEDPYYDHFHAIIPECARYLHETSHFKDFITATPDLERLDINFDCDAPCPPATLCDTIGTFTWHSLRVAAFAYISADEDCLAQFFVRHAGTLRKLRLETILLNTGSWPSLLRDARKTLTLEQACLCGRLRSQAPKEDYWLDTPAGLNGGKRAKIEIAIEEYLLAGGEGPLLDLRALTAKLRLQYVYPPESLPMFVDADSDEAIMDRF